MLRTDIVLQVWSWSSVGWTVHCGSGAVGDGRMFCSVIGG